MKSLELTEDQHAIYKESWVKLWQNLRLQFSSPKSTVSWRVTSHFCVHINVNSINLINNNVLWQYLFFNEGGFSLHCIGLYLIANYQ